MIEPSRPRSNRRQRKSSGNALAWFGVAAIGLIVAVAVGWAVFATSNAATLDRTTMCEKAGPTAVTTILIDATDDVSSLQELAVSNRLEKIVRTLQQNERIDVFTIRPGIDPLKPYFSMCRPASGDETSQWTANKAQADRRFHEQFKPALTDALNALLGAPEANTSPIMEAIQAAAVRSLQAPDLRTDAPTFRKRLVVTSDMLQNSPLGSHLSTIPDWDQFEDSPAMRAAASDLSDTEVTILYLNRDEAVVQGRRHVEFWNSWFGAQGGTVESAVPIEG